MWSGPVKQTVQCEKHCSLSLRTDIVNSLSNHVMMPQDLSLISFQSLHTQPEYGVHTLFMTQ